MFNLFFRKIRGEGYKIMKHTVRREIGIINPRLSVAPGARPTHHGFLPETKNGLSLYVGYGGDG